MEYIVKEKQVSYLSYHFTLLSDKKLKRIVDFLMKEVADGKIFKKRYNLN